MHVNLTQFLNYTMACWEKGMGVETIGHRQKKCANRLWDHLHIQHKIKAWCVCWCVLADLAMRFAHWW